MTTPPFVRRSVEDHVMTVVLDRPPVNAIVPAVLDELHDAFASVATDDAVRAAILVSGNDRVFCAGADTKARPPDAVAPALTATLDPGRRMRRTLEAIMRCEVPVIAAVNGPALGSGLGLAASCDIIVASERAVFGLPEIDVGVLGGASHLQRMVGPYRAREMFLLARRATAQEMADAGAVARVVAHDELLAVARSIATEIASKDVAAVRLAKEAFNRIESLPVSEGYRIEQDYTARLRGLRGPR